MQRAGGQGGRLCVEPRRGRAARTSKWGDCRIPPQLQCKPVRAQGRTGPGMGIGVEGHVWHTATCLPPLPSPPRHVHPQRCPQSSIHTNIRVYAQTGSETHKGTPMHTQIPDALVNTLRCSCGHTHPLIWFLPCVRCQNTASGWVTEAGTVSCHRLGLV